MTHQLSRITTVLGSLLVSTIVLAAASRSTRSLSLLFGPTKKSSCTTSRAAARSRRRACACAKRASSISTVTARRTCSSASMNSSDPNDTRGPSAYLGRGEGLFNPPFLRSRSMPTSAIKIANLDNDGDLDMVETVRADGTSGGTSDVNTIYVNRTARCRVLGRRTAARQHSLPIIVGRGRRRKQRRQARYRGRPTRRRGRSRTRAARIAAVHPYELRLSQSDNDGRTTSSSARRSRSIRPVPSCTRAESC